MGMVKAIEKKKGLKLKHVLWGAAILLFAAFVIWLVESGKVSIFRAESDKLTIGDVTEGYFNDYITVTGQVQPISTIFLDAAEGGKVAERLIEEGAMVKKGDVILKLENRQLYQNILESEAALAEKENYLRTTRINFETEQIESRRNILDSEYKANRKKRTYEQYQTLFDQGLISREDYIQSKEDYDYVIQPSVKEMGFYSFFRLFFRRISLNMGL